MKNYVVTTYRPPYPEKGVKILVLKAEDYPDTAPPSLTSAWHVENVTNKDEAIAVALEYAAGKPVTASLMIPSSGPRPQR